MNQEQVKKQLNNMEAFILKEAREKVNEINDRAEEEFTIEKARLVQAEKQRIKNEYERKKKQVEVKNKITFSNKLNQARLRKLKAREDIVLGLKDETKERLVLLSRPGPEYRGLLKLLIVQGLLKLNEPKVSLRVREEDKGEVQAVMADSAKEFQAKAGKPVELVIDVHYLPPGPKGGFGISCAGGVLLCAQDEAIVCDNTLDQRLGLAFDSLIPEIRRTIFHDVIGF